MNLFRKLINYIHCKKNKIRNAYRVSFDYPMTEADRTALIVTLIMAIVFLLSMLYTDFEIKQNINTVLTNEYNARIVALSKELEQERELALKNELLLVSVMNGAVKERGCVVKYKRIGCEL